MNAFIESWFWAMMQFLIVLISLVFIYKQLRTQTASHIVSTLNSINARWNSEGTLKARYFYCKYWLSCGKELDALGELIAEVLEEIGTIVRIRAVPKNVIWETHSWYIEHYYYMFKDGIQKVRDECNDQSLYSEFEWLCEEMQKIDAKRKSPYGDKTDDQLRIFASGEYEIAGVAHFIKDDTFEPNNANKSNHTDSLDAAGACGVNSTSSPST